MSSSPKFGEMPANQPVCAVVGPQSLGDVDLEGEGTREFDMIATSLLIGLVASMEAATA